MQLRINFITALALISLEANSQPRISRVEYINKFKDIAISEMKRTGIPASIKLAQGILESGDGNSTLTRKANNHFGIKCHDWQGPRMYHDDDKKGECFRKYRHAAASYSDHSDFLKNRPRYAFLFEYSTTDYKSWAHGLKQAGYATNPAYPQLLIKIIEENNLSQYDRSSKPLRTKREQGSRTKTPINTEREVIENNRVKYIIWREGDNLTAITDELGLLPRSIYRYNDFDEKYNPVPGDWVYIQPKRKKASTGNNNHTVKAGETMHSIAQRYGIRLSALTGMNQLSPDAAPVEGTEILLRGRANLVNSLPVKEEAAEKPFIILFDED